MTPYTLTVSEAETQPLRALVERTQTTRRPILLTNENLAEPIAVLVESGVFELLRRKERQLFQLQLRQLLQEILAFDAEWHETVTHASFASSFPSGTHALWQACPEELQDLCVTLDLAARRLSPDQVTRQQLSALRSCLELLQDGAPDEQRIAQCEQELINVGLPPTMGGSDTLVQAYREVL